MNGKRLELSRWSSRAQAGWMLLALAAGVGCFYGPKDPLAWPSKAESVTPDPPPPLIQAAVVPAVASPPPRSEPVPPPKPRDLIDARLLGRNHALLIANQRYAKVPALATPEADVSALREILESRYGFDVTTLVDATGRQILETLHGFRVRLMEDDNLLLFYAGHGEIDHDTDRGYWIPIDGEAQQQWGWVPVDDITNELRAMRARHVLVVSDSCYSAAMTRDLAIYQRPTGSLEKVASRRMRRVITAGGMQPVLDSGGGKHSIFAGAFIRALEDNRSYTTASDIFEFVAPKVRQNTAGDQRPQFNPIPKAGDEDGDFIFADREAVRR